MNFNEFISQLLYIVATGILPVLTVYIVSLLKVKIKEQTTRLEDEQLEKYINSATEVIGQVVLEVNQTFVDSLKKSGAFTADAALEAKDLAVEKCKQLISDNSKKAIEVMYNDFDLYLNSKIEELVREYKETI
jgi:hypothetical protein